MWDKVRVQALLNRIVSSIQLILSKSELIRKPEDFVTNQDGMFLLSGICMQLIFIGESIKVIDKKTSGQYLNNYPDIPWVEIMGLRDIIAHEYHRIDEEEIYEIIKEELPNLLDVILKMKSDL